ncbi:MAG: hypothetical protein P8P53_11045, partial [Tateyamaria sp.]|nr:hypothetical protein [Tateyamaria sp.]
ETFAALDDRVLCTSERLSIVWSTDIVATTARVIIAAIRADLTSRLFTPPVSDDTFSITFIIVPTAFALSTERGVYFVSLITQQYYFSINDVFGAQLPLEAYDRLHCCGHGARMISAVPMADEAMLIFHLMDLNHRLPAGPLHRTCV